MHVTLQSQEAFNHVDRWLEYYLAVQQRKVGGTFRHVQDQDKLFDRDSKQKQT